MDNNVSVETINLDLNGYNDRAYVEPKITGFINKGLGVNKHWEYSDLLIPDNSPNNPEGGIVDTIVEKPEIQVGDYKKALAELGKSTLIIASQNQIEEDVLSIPDDEYLFSKETREYIANKAISDAAIFVDKFIGLKKFPNLQFAFYKNGHPKAPSDLGIRVNMIPNELFYLMFQNGENENLGHVYRGLLNSDPGYINLSEANNIFVRETPDLHKSGNGIYTKLSTPTLNAVLEANLEHVIRHEVIHLLVDPKFSNVSMYEGLTEFLAELSGQDLYRDLRKDLGLDVYTQKYDLADIFIVLAEVGNFTATEILEYFCSNDDPKFERMNKFLKSISTHSEGDLSVDNFIKRDLDKASSYLPVMCHRALVKFLGEQKYLEEFSENPFDTIKERYLK